MSSAIFLTRQMFCWGKCVFLFKIWLGSHMKNTDKHVSTKELIVYRIFQQKILWPWTSASTATQAFIEVEFKLSWNCSDIIVLCNDDCQTIVPVYVLLHVDDQLIFLVQLSFQTCVVVICLLKAPTIIIYVIDIIKYLFI